MRIVEGGLPEDKAWRALVVLVPGDDLAVAWQLALSLSLANDGELVAAIVLSKAVGVELEAARQMMTKAQHACKPEDPVYTVIVESTDYASAARKVISDADIDLLVAKAGAKNWSILEKMPCAVAAVRGDAYGGLAAGGSDLAANSIDKILVPTSGGPNSAHALSFLLPLTSKGVGVTALYISPRHLGENEKALGRHRLRQTLNYIDAGDKIESRLIAADSVIEGIIEETKSGFDLVMIGATRESSLDKTLFGNIPAAVVRESHRPVVVVREPTSRVGSFFRDISWAMQGVIPRLNLQERTSSYVRIRSDARPDTDFFVLIGLSAGIAALGLLANSGAVVIGAMLVAPLMSPLAGIGLAMVLGDARFLRLALGAVLRGAILVLFVALLIGLIPLSDPFTDQVSSRTQPTLLDLGVAILSGMAVAYALCKSEATAALPGVAIAAALVPPLAAAGISFSSGYLSEGFGALLLFVTNLTAISVAAALVFLVLGFRPMLSQKERRSTQIRSARLAIMLLIVVTVILAVTTYTLANESATESRIRELAESGVEQFTTGEFSELTVGELNEDVLELGLVVLSTETIPHSAVVDLQEYVATELQREVALSLVVIPTTILDPFVPPEIPPTPALEN